MNKINARCLYLHDRQGKNIYCREKYFKSFYKGFIASYVCMYVVIRIVFATRSIQYFARNRNHTSSFPRRCASRSYRSKNLYPLIFIISFCNDDDLDEVEVPDEVDCVGDMRYDQILNIYFSCNCSRCSLLFGVFNGKDTIFFSIK